MVVLYLTVAIPQAVENGKEGIHLIVRYSFSITLKT